MNRPVSPGGGANRGPDVEQRRHRLARRRGVGIATSRSGDQMNPQEAFVTQLRRHRQKMRISLEEIAAEMRVKRELLEALENNDLTEWPRGLYARALMRAYASAVELDPIDT